MVRKASEGNRNAASSAPALIVKPPWASWRTRSLPARAIRFMQTFCIPSKGHRVGKPLKLGRFQTDWVERVLAPGVEASVMTLPRGQGKSTFGGGFGSWALHDELAAEEFGGKPDIPIIATTVKQAKKSVYGAVRDFHRNSAELGDRSIEYTANGEERIWIPSTDGAIYPVASDPDTLQGLDPMIAFVDEVGFVEPDAWDALLLAGGKRPRNLFLGLGTRNPSDDPNALDHLLAQVELMGLDAMPEFVLVDYHAPLGCAIDDVKAWREANPAIAEGFLRESALRTALKLSPEASFRCFRLNQKSGALHGWLGVDGPTLWDATELDSLPFSNLLPMTVGVDKSAFGDQSAVVALQCVEGVWLARAWIFTPRPTVDHAAVRDRIRTLCAEWNVSAVGFDPRYFVEGAQELADEGLPLVHVPQTPQRLVPAYSSLYEAIKARRFGHLDDPMFRAHVLGAVPQIDSSGGFTLKKGRSKVKIDAAVAMGIARAVQDIEPDETYTDESFRIPGGPKS